MASRLILACSVLSAAILADVSASAAAFDAPPPPPAPKRLMRYEDPTLSSMMVVTLPAVLYFPITLSHSRSTQPRGRPTTVVFKVASMVPAFVRAATDACSLENKVSIVPVFRRTRANLRYLPTVPVGREKAAPLTVTVWPTIAPVWKFIVVAEVGEGITSSIGGTLLPPPSPASMRDGSILRRESAVGKVARSRTGLSVFFPIRSKVTLRSSLSNAPSVARSAFIFISSVNPRIKPIMVSFSLFYL